MTGLLLISCKIGTQTTKPCWRRVAAGPHRPKHLQLWLQLRVHCCSHRRLVCVDVGCWAKGTAWTVQLGVTAAAYVFAPVHTGRIHESVEDTKLSINKQHTLSYPCHHSRSSPRKMCRRQRQCSCDYQAGGGCENGGGTEGAAGAKGTG